MAITKLLSLFYQNLGIANLYNCFVKNLGAANITFINILFRISVSLTQVLYLFCSEFGNS